MNFNFKSTDVVFSRPRKAEPRSRAGPMDIDFDDRDSSWLTSPTAAKTNTPAADPSDGSSTRKRRLITHPTFSDSSSSRTDGPVIGTGSMALGNTPFTFSMPPPPSPANDASAMSQPQATEPMVVDLEQRPISPNAVRRIYSRRRHNNSLRSSITALLGLGQGTRHTGNARGQRGPAADDGSWTTDEEDDGEEPVAATASDHSTTQRTPEHRDGASGRRQRRAQVSRRESNGAATRGVDRVLALMGTRVDEPTMVERLQMHRDIPYVISGYLQLAFNVFMVGTVLTIIINVLMTIQRDVNAKVQEYSAVVMQEIVACSKQYLENKCAPEMRVPAMEKACNMWDTCMNQDPSKVGRAKVSAETLAGIVNGFIEPLSLKTMMFFLLMFFGTLFVSNFAFGAYRHSRVHQQYVNQSSVGESPATGGGSRRNRNRNRSRSRSRSRSQSQSRSGNSGSRADPMSSATHTSQQQYDQPAQSSAASSSNMLVLSNSVRRRPPAQQMFR
ncbi:hypothetical protein LPJ66_000577 [Kickxella alabastrina]|uniref:Uncharacterized protein n=1 Tax=Kickxella alabastrina TaxID=61397 RepID=A0ACC1IVS1_9FUNG|nr:hypothetical protein LPJ66_000577 [Kickxella alabastrina]